MRMSRVYSRGFICRQFNQFVCDIVVSQPIKEGKIQSNLYIIVTLWKWPAYRYIQGDRYIQVKFTAIYERFSDREVQFNYIIYKGMEILTVKIYIENI